MKTLFTLFVLFFSSSVVADDIRDFQIEGMSVGDSALDFFTEEEITKSKKSYYPKSKKYYRIYPKLNSNEYDNLQIDMKSNDDKFILYALTGILKFDGMNKCELKRKNILNDITLILQDFKKEEYTYNYPNDNSVSQVTNFVIQDGTVRIYCTDYSISREEQNFKDHLGVNLSSSEFTEWLYYEAR